jgi:hypothetical protein
MFQGLGKKDIADNKSPILSHLARWGAEGILTRTFFSKPIAHFVKKKKD